MAEHLKLQQSLCRQIEFSPFDLLPLQLHQLAVARDNSYSRCLTTLVEIKVLI
jgi:hypothetical protein